MVSKVESQLPLGFNSEVESYLYPRFNLGQLSVVKDRGWLNLLGIGLASNTRTSPYFLTNAPIASFSERNEALPSPLLVNDLQNIILTKMFFWRLI